MTSLTQAKNPFGRALRNVGWLLTGKGVGAILSIAYLALATRSLGVERFGQFILILSTAQAVAAFVGFQTWQVVVRYGASHREAGEPQALARLVRFCMALDLGGALAGIMIAGAALLFMQAHFNWSIGRTQTAFAFSVILLLSVRSTAVGILRLHDRFAIGAVADAVTPMMRFLGAIVSVWQHATLTGFLIAWAVAEVLTAIAYWIAATRAMPGVLRHWQGTLAAPAENPGLWHFAFVTNLNTTLTVASRQLVVVLVGVFTGASVAGSYRLAYQLSQSLVRVSDMFARGVFPEVTRAHASDEAIGLVTLGRQSARLAVGVGLITCALVPVLGQPALRLIAGETYLDAYPVLVLLGLAAGLDIMATGFEPILLGTGRATQALRIRVAATIALFTGVVILMPPLGVLGAGAASLIASSFALALFARAGLEELSRRAPAPARR